MAKTRAGRKKGQGKTPTKRALKGAQKVGRQDPERGVTSRARKRKQGTETVPDPRYGGRPGRKNSKWGSAKEKMSPRQRKAARAKK